MNPLMQLHPLGQSVWLDYIQRDLLRSGALARMIRDDGVRGITSNPTIFEKAINGSTEYDAAVMALMAKNPHASSRDVFFSLAIEDIQGAADLLRPVYEQSGARDGMVSLEVSPDLAYDTDATVAEARRLHERVNRPNLMIKVPATREGLPAVETLIRDGINVNVTLLFSVQRYKEVVDAYLKGLEARVRDGQPVHQIASVASFFISRVDATVDKVLEDKIRQLSGPERDRTRALLGAAAIANAKVAYQAYQGYFTSQRFKPLMAAGAQTQRLLWASTGTKNPDYSDVLYVDKLIGSDTVNTMPPATLDAFKDHGTPASTLEVDIDQARRTLTELKNRGVDMDDVTDRLERDGVKLFADSFSTLLASIEKKSHKLAGAALA
jgi:transaldolase